VVFTETPHCCEIWPKIVGAFEWFAFEDNPEFFTMSYISIALDMWRVNFCPSCGKERRMAILKRSTVEASRNDLT
jgi:hypothetical protein